MKCDQKKWHSWILLKNNYLPGVQNLLESVQTRCLIIGAAVFELYELQEWIPLFQRKTGDLDLSIEISGSMKAYDFSKSILLSKKYTQDRLHPYRYHPPVKITGGQTYVDLLAHPIERHSTPLDARQAMGAVGDDFSFKGISFANHSSFKLLPNVYAPNPLGFIFLKMVSYQNNPAQRLKDFADIVELISGLVEKGTHFEMTNLWNTSKTIDEAKKLKENLTEIATDHVRWDIDNIRNELLSRNFSSDFIDETLRHRISDFIDCLE